MLVNRKKFCNFGDMSENKHKSKNVGNKAAQVWTVESANAFIKKIHAYVVENEDCRSMATACANNDSYETVINYLERLEFAKDIDFKPIKKCHQLFKSRLMEQGLENKVNATMAIFILKNNHGMSDKVENKNDNLNINADKDITADEVKAIKNALKDAY